EGYVGLLEGVLESQGRHVEVIGFPADMALREIKFELEKLADILGRSVVFTDRTVEGQLPGHLRFPGQAPTTIDGIFCGCGLEIVCRELGIKTAFEVEVPEQTEMAPLQAYLHAHRERHASVFR